MNFTLYNKRYSANVIKVRTRWAFNMIISVLIKWRQRDSFQKKVVMRGLKQDVLLLEDGGRAQESRNVRNVL